MNAEEYEGEQIDPRELEPVAWRCEGCGQVFHSERSSHCRPDHAPGCDGSCRGCPVPVECGPVGPVFPNLDRSVPNLDEA